MAETGGYLVFELDAEKSAGRRTEVWNVLAARDRALLGEIRWYGPWWQYTFQPAPSTTFNPGCLREIADKAGCLTYKFRERRRLVESLTVAPRTLVWPGHTGL